MILFVKPMVCVRCMMAVQSVFDQAGIPVIRIEMGRVYLARDLTGDEHQRVQEGLKKYELELLDNNKSIIAGKVRQTVHQLIYFPPPGAVMKYTVELSLRLSYDYTYLSNVFTEMEGITIERLYITTRIERVKELMMIDRLSLKQITFDLNFSSVAHLCQQFKKITGMRPSDYRKEAMPG